MRFTRPVSLLLACVLAFHLSGCRRGESPESTAQTVLRAQIAGDEQRLLSLLSHTDSVAAARYYGTDTLTRITTQGGDPGATLDSLRLLKTAGDSAVVQGILTVPNWERVGGRFDYSTAAERDRGTDAALVASLPRVQERRAVLLLREGGRWRAWVAERAQWQRHDLPARDRRLPIAERVRHFDSLLALPNEFRGAQGGLRHQRAALAAIDSLTFQYSVRSVAGVEIDVSNASSTPLESVDATLTDADGIEHEVLVVHIPAHGRSYTFENIRLPVRSLRINQAEYWDR